MADPAALDESVTEAGQPAEGGAVRRVGWGLADQTLSSATNFMLAVLVARSVDPASFGAFALGYIVYALALGTARAVAGEPLAVRYSYRTSDEIRTAGAAAAGTALALGVLAGAAVIAVGLALGAPTRATLVPVGLFLPGLLVQDAWRSVFLALGRPARAFANDLVWMVVQFGGLAVVLAHQPTVGALVTVWGAAAALAAFVGAGQAGFRPSLKGTRRWLATNRDLWPRFATEFWAMSGTWQLTIVVLTGTAGLEAVGAVRGAQTFLGPLNLLFLAVPLVLVPEAARLRQRKPERMLGMCGAVGITLAVIASVATLVGLAVPASVGRQILGETWTTARPVLLATGLFVASTGANIGAMLGLRAAGAARQSLRVRLIVSPLILAGGFVGGLAGGALGAAVGLALANWIATFFWWRAVFRLTRTDGEQR
ncbi:MAG: hypothetical protein LC733_07675 [Actinobacteria bacterium]|nr:hypothetical protein [Actinomycetota bacterium]